MLRVNQLIGFGARRVAVVGGGGPFFAWNPADKAAGVTLTNSDLTATRAAGTSYSVVRSVTFHQTAKYYYEMTLVVVGSSPAIGFAAASQSLTPPYLGFTQDGGGVYFNGTFEPGTVNGVIVGGYGNGDTIGVAVRKDVDKFWMRKGAAGNWNGNGTYDPVTNTGGISLPTNMLGAVNVYAACVVHGGGDSITLNTGGSAFVGATPSGFTAWG